MDQRVRTETGPPPGVPERRGRRGTASVARDRIPFQQPEPPPTLAIMAYFQRSVEEAYFAPDVLGTDAAWYLDVEFATATAAVVA